MTTSLRGHANAWAGAPWRMSAHYKFGEHRYCDSWDTRFLFVHISSLDHMFKGLWKLMGESFSRYVIILPCLLAIWPNASEDIKYLICNVTSQNHIIKGSCNFMNGSPSRGFVCYFFEGVSDGKLPPYQVWWQQTLW